MLYTRKKKKKAYRNYSSIILIVVVNTCMRSKNTTSRANHADSANQGRATQSKAEKKQSKTRASKPTGALRNIPEKNK